MMRALLLIAIISALLGYEVGASNKRKTLRMSYTLFPTHLPTTSRPTRFPTPFPTTALPTTFPTRLPSTARPTTQFPTTTLFPSPFPTATAKPSSLPVAAAPPTTCSAARSSYSCSAKPGCAWTSQKSCTYASGRYSCVTFQYGCQPLGSFCAFTQGSVYDQMFQCNQRAGPCKWSGSQCVTGTLRPTSPQRGRTVCVNTCIPFNRNRVCEDGGKGSKAMFCLLGTDCADCGPRTVYY
ncbi:hypothetical protein BASA81_002471 [Batrachochytrium salamandrivorans]|nr:hypothetical protein BASA81_002471 [Batrachochytrium salamandrivorans]